MSDTQRVINVINQAIDQQIADQITYTPGTVYQVTSIPSFTYSGATLMFAVVTDAGGEGLVASAYVQGDNLIEDIIIPSGAYVTAGDYVVVATNQDGKSWVDRMLASSLYDKMVLDYSRGRIGTGTGLSDAFDFGQAEDFLLSGGTDSGVTWGRPRAYRGVYGMSAPQTILLATDTDLQWTTTAFDDFQIVSLPATELVPNKAGVWNIEAQVDFEVMTDCTYEININKNGTRIAGISLPVPSLTVEPRRVSLSIKTSDSFDGSADDVSVSVYHDASSSLDVLTTSRVNITWVGPF